MNNKSSAKSPAVPAAEAIANIVDRHGGTAYYVGGCVRDKLMGRDNYDIDIEVHGIEACELAKILREVGEPLKYGQSFGIFSLKGANIDIALPRRERATGSGHRDFEIDVDPHIGTYAAAIRRDFTINALMENVITGEITDHFGGREDIGKGIIRHICDETFVEDALRVLRAAQFAARFRFEVAAETLELCRGIDITKLSRERVEGELRKALLLSDKPSIFFETLRDMDQLGYWFPELEALIGVEQDPVYHPEGDVWTHTMEVLDRAALYRDRTSNPYAFMLLALTHDMGKAVTTEFIKGRFHAYGHESAGVPIAREFLRRITNERELIKYVLTMIPLHMKPNVAAYSKPKIKSTNHMFDQAVSPQDLIYLSMSDRPLIAGNEKFSGDADFLWDRLRIYEETMAQPYVNGRDLIEAGIKPGVNFSELLNYAHKLRLAGVDKENALKQLKAYCRKLQ